MSKIQEGLVTAPTKQITSESDLRSARAWGRLFHGDIHADRRLIFRKYVTFLVLSIGTLITYYTVGHYNDIGNQLLVNQDFFNGFQGWSIGGTKTVAAVSVGPGFVRLHSYEQNTSVGLSQSLDATMLGEKIALRAEVKTVGIEGGKKGWEKGRVVLIQSVEGKPIYTTPHVLATIDGTTGWTKYRATFSILARVSGVRAELQLNNCTGELQVKDLALYQVQVNPVYRLFRLMVFGGWAFYAVCMFGPGLIGTGAGRKRTILVLLVCIAIVIGTTIPGAVKNEAKYELLSHAHCYAHQVLEHGGVAVHTLASELKAEKWLWIDITKVAHFLLFALLGGLLYAGQGKGAVWRTFVDTGMLACGTELLQLFIDDRSALVSDVFIDLAGVGCAVLLVSIFARRGRGGGDKGVHVRLD